MTTSLRRFLALSPTREQLEAWCQQHARVVPAGEHNLCRVLGSKLIYAHQRDYAIMPHLALHGIWEPWVTLAIARHVKPGMSCLDVGACYGYFTLLLEELIDGDGYVEAWEPVWNEVLAASLSVNGSLAVLRPFSMGTGNLPAMICAPPGGGALFNAGNLRGGPRFAERGQVPTHGKYDFIKIDVEGAEIDVWKALTMTGCLKKSSVVVCMEFTPSKHSDPLRELEMIGEAGFDMGSVGHDGIPRPCSLEEVLIPDTGDFRMLWLTRSS